MKKSAFVAIMVVALVFGLVAYATALTENVTVTAKINPAFSMTLDSNTFDYGTLDLGAIASIPGPQITIKSNKLWSYAEAATLSTEPTLLAVESQTYTPSKAIGDRGVTVLDYDYSLDLTGDAAYDIPADTNMTLTYGYTALQLP